MNFSIQTTDEWLAALEKPSLGTISNLTLNTADWLIVCAGFEERAVAVLKRALSTSQAFNVLVIHYAPFFLENNAEAIRKLILENMLPLTELVYNRQEPAGFGSALLENLSSCEGKIFIDVSAMSRLLIVQILVALNLKPTGLANCSVTYAEAKEYTPTHATAKEELEKSRSDPSMSVLFLSSGIFDITVVPELSSFVPAGTQTRLVAFPSLDAHHLTALRNEIQPSRLTLVEGMPPDINNVWRPQVIASINKLDSIPDADRYLMSTLDYRETLDCLLNVYAKHAERERLLIAPTGSKMQTVAVGIFRAFISDVQIVYPTPISYVKPSEYTMGIGPLHLLPLNAFVHSS